MGKKSKQPEGCSRFRLNDNKNNARAPGALILQPPDPNKTISLDIDVKTVINPNPNYKPNKDLKVLLRNSLTTRRPKKRAGKPPRPQNAFFLFMRDKIHNPRYGKLLKDRVGKIAEQWRNASKEEKEVFEYYAEIAKEIHAAEYEDYQWFPQNDQQNRNDEPDDIKSAPPDRLDYSPISTSPSSEPDIPSPSFHDDHHGNESCDFELYNDQYQSTAINFDLLEAFLTYSQPELLNQTITMDDHQLYEMSFPPVPIEAYSPLSSYDLDFDQLNWGTFTEEMNLDNIDVFDIHQFYSYKDFPPIEQN